MINVSMELVKKLRDHTQVGMMDCKKALEESCGDFDKAVEVLRKKGASVAAKRTDNSTNHGRIESFIASDSKSGALVESACETDFSANTEAMRDFLHDIASHIVTENPTDIHTLLIQSLSKNKTITVRERLDELVAKICENIKINRFIRYSIADHGIVHSYIHPGSLIGVLVEIVTDKNTTADSLETIKATAKDICMHIAVTNPLCIDPSGLDQTTLAKERDIARDQLKNSEKPAAIIEKIIDGKIAKFYQDVCLLNQPFIKNDKQTIKQYIDEVSKKIGITMSVKQFKRFSIGR